MERGLIPFSPEICFLRPRVDESLNAILETAKAKNIGINIEIPEGMTVYADKYMLGSLFHNLVFNSVKFTQAGGMVTVSAKPLTNSWVEISIKDSGIGMDQKMIDNLFNLDINTNRKGTNGELSSGLGLHICRDIVEKHGGNLWVKSEVERGSIFYCTLPSLKNF